MAFLVYTRVSTDEQSTERQTYLCCARPLHVTALPQVHQALLAAAAALGADGALSADRKAYRIYHDWLHLAVTIAALPPDGRPYPPDLTAYAALLTTSGR
jgi:hypothetical protein